MKILLAEFLTSAVEPKQYPRQLRPEVAFAGRSNVGKSSLINTLLNRKGLVKTSSTPGKTRTLNFFLVNHLAHQNVVLVDLPGYGYAKVPREMQASWQPMVEAYLQGRDVLRAVVHIIDVRHPPTEQDQQLRSWLLSKAITVITVATKVDKLKRSQRAAHMAQVRRTLDMPETDILIGFSAQNHEGRMPLWGRLNPLLTPVVRASSTPFSA